MRGDLDEFRFTRAQRFNILSELFALRDNFILRELILSLNSVQIIQIAKFLFIYLTNIITMSQGVPTTTQIRKVIDSIEKEKYRHALMYGFLIAGSISEICEKNKPSGSDAHEVTFNVRGKKISAVLFAIKTARQRGKIRPCAIPLDNKIEPWARQLLDWFEDHKTPFNFVPRSLQRMSEAVFSDYQWPRRGYIPERGIKIPTDNIQFSTRSIRWLRKKNLKDFYLFNDIDLAIFGGWKEVTDPITSMKVNNILSRKIDINDIDQLSQLAEVYFEKLLKPLNQLESHEEYSKKYEDTIGYEKFNVFISYHRRTAGDYAEFLKNGLEEQNINTFLDTQDMPRTVRSLTTEWRNYRDRALINSKNILLIMTKGFEKSKEVIYEINLANKYGKELILFKEKILPYKIQLKINETEIDLSKLHINDFETKEDLLRQTLFLLE